MADLFTGFWEAKGGDLDVVFTTVRYEPVDVLLERLRVRLAEVPAGTHVRIDLVAWDDDGR
jgi:hypothetical protein